MINRQTQSAFLSDQIGRQHVNATECVSFLSFFFKILDSKKKKTFLKLLLKKLTFVWFKNQCLRIIFIEKEQTYAQIFIFT